MKILSGKQFPKEVIPLIDQSKISIDTVVFDWRWYPNDPACAVQLFNQAIVRAVRRCVKVRAIVSNNEIAKILNDCGCSAKCLITTNLVHAKLMIIDNEIVIIGSHNYTQSAFQTNFELSVILFQPNEIAEFSNFFQNLWQK
jgi:phosphatidylserine/phosphatidylglycerophosphate/cardiolipin synthase-like enzyme